MTTSFSPCLSTKRPQLPSLPPLSLTSRDSFRHRSDPKLSGLLTPIKDANELSIDENSREWFTLVTISHGVHSERFCGMVLSLRSSAAREIFPRSTIRCVLTEVMPNSRRGSVSYLKHSDVGASPCACPLSTHQISRQRGYGESVRLTELVSTAMEKSYSRSENIFGNACPNESTIGKSSQCPLL